MTKSVARLFEQFQPTNYELKLDIDPEAMTFSGTVVIDGKKAGRPSERLTFHQKDLKITGATVIKHEKSGDQELKVSRINNQDTKNGVRLHFDQTAYPGRYTVTMEFKGKITKPMNGIYPCFFKHDGQDKKLIATQFESHHAREAFPCIDEPEAKAIFDLTLITPQAETVIANTPVVAQEKVTNGFRTRFEPTPKMSAYLLAFTYGEMGYKEAVSKSGVTVRSYATPDNVQFAQSSADDAVKCLEFFENYFNIPYPLPKLDLVALPDFASGAMENWGLMTFRESIMLIDPQSTSIESRQVSALVICHEVSHQWFGNLVTMKWWDDLWLNESFANMMEYRGIAEIFPEWNIWEQFVAHEAVSAKRRDSLLGVQSVHIEVNHPDEINTVFDPSIVYAKGGNLLHMLMYYIGEDAFRQGLRDYFKQHAYGNTIADDLWAAFSAASGQDIGAFMQNWLTKPGYPLITMVTNGAELELTQKRFLSDPAVKDTDNTLWHVPLAASTGVTPALMTQATQVLQTTDSNVLLLNHNGQSYFVPKYESQHLHAISQAIQNKQVSTIDRLLLLDNYILLQRGGEAAATDLLELIQSYTDEASENVWGAIIMAIAEIRKLIEGDEKINDALDALIQKLVAPLLPTLNWDDNSDDSPQNLRLRSTMYALAAGAKEQTIIDEALLRFRNIHQPSDASASTRGVLYFAAARYGTDADYKKLLELYRTTQSHDEKDEIAGGLTSVKQADRYNQLLELIKTDEVRTQDITHWYAWLMRNRYSRAATWQWLQNNWDWLTEEMASDKSYDYLPRYSAMVFSKDDELSSYSDFFKDKREIVALTRAIELGEQEIAGRVAWRKRNGASVKAWLQK